MVCRRQVWGHIDFDYPSQDVHVGILFFNPEIQSSSVQSLSLCDPELQHARPPFHHQLPEFTQIHHVHRVGDAISQLILWRPLLLLPLIPPSITVFSNDSTLHMRWPSTGVSALASFLPKKEVKHHANPICFSCFDYLALP